MSATAAPTQQRPWWLTLVMGIAAVIVGGILLFGSLTAQARLYLLLIQLIGIWWVVDGIMHFVHMFTDHRGWGWKLVLGIISLIAGGWILIYPIYAAVALPRIFVLVLGFYGLFEGIVLLVMAFRGAGWGSGILGLLAMIFGIILIMNYDELGMGLSLIWVAALFAFFGGFAMIYMAFKQRSA
jgi:uncharacterized membrane protein HdeD (DUF308 family)